jgi:hypothetical protein
LGNFLYSCSNIDQTDLSALEKEVENIVVKANYLDSLSGDSLFNKHKWMQLDSSISLCLEKSAYAVLDEQSNETVKNINSKVKEYVQLRLKATNNLISIRIDEAAHSDE